MNAVTYLAMIGWIPFSLFVFSKYPGRWACIIVFMLGWMFLPQAKFDLPVLPDYNKTTAVTFFALVGAMMFDQRSVLAVKFHPVDLPVIAWVVSSMLSSVTNGLGPFDGLSAAMEKIMVWGLPYFLGRVYFSTLDGFKDLAIGMFIAGLVYAPFCLIEMVISPQMHRLVYGWFPHDFSQTRRWGGWRPVVFMIHGLMLAMWMACATFMGWQLLLRGVVRKSVPFFPFLPLLPAVVGLSAVMFLCKSSGALLLLAIAFAVLLGATFTKKSTLFVVLLVLPLLYMGTRATGFWDGQNLINAAGAVTRSEERAGSLEFRLRNENVLVEKAQARLWFGWGGWKRSFVMNEKGDFTSVPDGLWILTLGENGLFGLIALTASLLLPAFLFGKRWPAKFWADPVVAPAAAFAVFLGIFMVDNLLNDMFNPIMMLAAGGLSGVAIHPLGGRTPEVGGHAAAAPERRIPVTRVI